MNTYRGKTLGWGPWRRDWYSVCSAHREPVDCRLCLTGRYVWAVPHLVSRVVYRVAPGMWRWWVNRKVGA